MSLDRKDSSSRWRFTLRLIGSVCALAVVALLIDFSDVASFVLTLSPVVWVMVFAGFVLGHIFAALKWRRLVGARRGVSVYLRAHFAGLAANLALPGVAGGDVVRAGLLISDGSVASTNVIVGSLIDRLIDVFALVLLAIVGLALVGSQIGWAKEDVLVLGFCVFGMATLSFLLLPRLLQRISRVKWSGKLGSLIEQALPVLSAIAIDRWSVLSCFLISTLIQLMFVALTVCIATNLGAEIAFELWVFAWPVAKIFSMLPISLGGLGVREGALVWGVGLLVTVPEQLSIVVASSLVWQTILLGAGLLGVLAQFVGRSAGSVVKGEAE